MSLDQSIRQDYRTTDIGVNRFAYLSSYKNSDMKKPSEWATFGGRVKWARANKKPKGISQTQLATAAGLKQPTISDIENDVAEASRKTSSLARALGVSANWLESNRGLPYDAQAQAIIDEADGEEMHRADVVGEATMGVGGTYDLVGIEPGTAGYVKYIGPPGGVALRCVGNSMRPTIVPGMFVVVHENIRPSEGDLVAVETKKDGRLMIKLLNWRRDGAMELTSINEIDQGPLRFFEEEIAHVYRATGPIRPKDHKDYVV